MKFLIPVFLMGICTAQATLVQLGPPPGVSKTFGSSIGNSDRSTAFTALANFSITSAGIEFDPGISGATSIRVDIFALSLMPTTRGASLATANTAITDVGTAFYHVPINFSFTAGTSYDVAFNSVTPAGWGTALNTMTFFKWDPPVPGDVPFNTTPALLTVLDGSAGGNFGNDNLPFLEFDAQFVPEPSSFVLLGIGLAALIGMRRYRRQ